MKKIEIFTDGACSGNPGPGGWGAILRYEGHEKELSGYEAETTNNRMELKAVIEAVKAVNQPCEITITSDSAYVCNAFLEGWIDSWTPLRSLPEPRKPLTFLQVSGFINSGRRS